MSDQEKLIWAVLFIGMALGLQVALWIWTVAG